MDDSLLLNPVASRAEPTGLGLSAATALIIADNVGTGVFALPGQVAKLGRVAGLCALALMLVPNLGAALMLHRAAAIVERAAAPTGRAPSRSRAAVRDYAHLAARLCGPRAPLARVTAFFFYLSVFLQMANYLVVLGETLPAALAVPLCRPWAGVASALVTCDKGQQPWRPTRRPDLALTSPRRRPSARPGGG